MDAISDTTAAAAPDSAAKPAEASLTQAVRWRVPVVSAAHATVGQSRNPSLPTFVGLIILILTFFIVLTSISIHDKTKSDAAIASVQDAFGNAVTIEDVPEKDEEIAREYIEGLTHRIQSLMPLMGGKKGPASDHQVLWLPAELAFAADGTTLSPVFPTVLREVVNSLSGVPRRLTPQIEMRLCATGPSDALRARAVAIGSALFAEKAPLKQFAIGVAACNPKTIGIAVALAPATDPMPADAGEQAP